MTALSFRDVTVGYSPNDPIVQGVSFDLEPGAFLGLIGPNGAGKSTIAKCLVGESIVISGDVTLEGKRLHEYSFRDRAQVLGVVPQTLAVPFSLTAREFVELGRSAHRSFGFSAPHDEKDRIVIEQVMVQTDTDYLADSPLEMLSGGEVQRLYLAQALASSPRVLILDEPTSHLDINHRLQVLDLMRELAAQQGLAILGIFHDFELAARYADAISIVSPRVTASGRTTLQPSVSYMTTAAPPKEALTEEMFRCVFGVNASVSLGVDESSVRVEVRSRINI